MNPLRTLAIIAAIAIVMASATIANCKFNKWNNYKQSEITKSYLDLLEEETGNLGVAGQKELMKKAIREVYNEKSN